MRWLDSGFTCFARLLAGAPDRIKLRAFRERPRFVPGFCATVPA